MKLDEAVQKNLPYRRKGWKQYADPKTVPQLQREDMIADDWEVWSPRRMYVNEYHEGNACYFSREEAERIKDRDRLRCSVWVEVFE